MNIISILSSIAPSIFKIIDDAVADKDLAARLKHDLSKQMLDQKGEIVKASSNVIMAEAKGESWLQRSWRPLMMVWFAILIGGYWFGFVPNNMPVEIVEDLFTLVQIGIGGYVGGRTVEKVADKVAPLLKKGP